MLLEIRFLRRPAPTARSSVEVWRQVALTQFAEDRITIRPWVHLVSLDLSCNEVRELDTEQYEPLDLSE